MSKNDKDYEFFYGLNYSPSFNKESESSMFYNYR